jgi:hypothetical protein
MNAYFWVMWKQKLVNKAYCLYDKTKKSVFLIRDVIFNEAIMVLKEGEPIIDAYVYDLIEEKITVSCLLILKLTNVFPSLLVPIFLIMGSLRVSFFT